MNLLFASKDSPCVVEARSFKSTTRWYRIHILQVTFFRNLSQLIPSNGRIQKTMGNSPFCIQEDGRLVGWPPQCLYLCGVPVPANHWVGGIPLVAEALGVGSCPPKGSILMVSSLLPVRRTPICKGTQQIWVGWVAGVKQIMGLRKPKSWVLLVASESFSISSTCCAEACSVRCPGWQSSWQLEVWMYQKKCATASSFAQFTGNFI